MHGIIMKLYQKRNGKRRSGFQRVGGEEDRTRERVPSPPREGSGWSLKLLSRKHEFFHLKWRVFGSPLSSVAISIPRCFQPMYEPVCQFKKFSFNLHFCNITRQQYKVISQNVHVIML